MQRVRHHLTRDEGAAAIEFVVLVVLVIVPIVYVVLAAMQVQAAAYAAALPARDPGGVHRGCRPGDG